MLQYSLGENKLWELLEQSLRGNRLGWTTVGTCNSGIHRTSDRTPNSGTAVGSARTPDTEAGLVSARSPGTRIGTGLTSARNTDGDKNHQCLIHP